MTTLLSLIGEQPIPILLVHRALKPERHLLAASDRTMRVAKNLKRLLPHASILPLTDAYDLEKIRQSFEEAFAPGMVFNLTSGTKPMAWAGYEVARAHRGSVVYLQSEGKQSRLHTLDFSSAVVAQASALLPPLITIDDYLKAHGLYPQLEGSFSNRQEVALSHFLREHVDECKSNLKFPAFEIDFLVRRGNQVAVVEAKAKKKSTRFGIDQLTTITGREYLGTYTGRIWVVSTPPADQLLDLAKAYRIEVVLVSIYEKAPGRWRLKSQSRARLASALDKVLGQHSGR